MRGEECFEFFLRHRLAVEVALAVLAAAIDEHLLLFFRLDAFADDGHAERVAEVGHSREHGAHAPGVLTRKQQRAVELHDIERQRVEQRHVAVARAEVVHVDAEAEPLELRDDGERVLALLAAREVERRLRELELDAVRRVDADLYGFSP